jgi:hypothetical protein
MLCKAVFCLIFQLALALPLNREAECGKLRAKPMIIRGKSLAANLETVCRAECAVAVQLTKKNAAASGCAAEERISLTCDQPAWGSIRTIRYLRHSSLRVADVPAPVGIRACQQIAES